jgi:outer membrane protein TolC
MAGLCIESMKNGIMRSSPGASGQPAFPADRARPASSARGPLAGEEKRSMFLPRTMRAAIVVAAAMASLPASAQRTIGVDDAVAAALSSDESLKQAMIALEARKRAVDLGWSDLLPSVSASAGLSSSASLPDSSFSDGLKAAGSLSASLTLSPSSKDSRSVDRIAYESQLIAYEAARRKVELAARKAVYAILLDEERLKNAKASVERSRESYAQTEAKYKAGLAPELDLLTAKVSLETLKPTVGTCETALASDLDSLRSLMSLPPDEAIEAEGSLEVPDAAIDALLAAAAGTSGKGSSVESAKKALTGAESSLSEVKSSKYMPSLSLSLSAMPSRPLKGGSELSASLSASVMLSYPIGNLLPGSMARQAVASAQDAVDTAASALRAVQESSALALKKAARDVSSCRQSLAALELNVDLAGRAYEATKSAYDKGFSTLTALQSAQGSLESAKLSVLSKSYDLIAAVLELESEASLPFDYIGRF